MTSATGPRSIWEQPGRSLQYRTLAGCWRQCQSDCPGRSGLERLAGSYQARRRQLPGSWSGEIRRRDTVHRLAQLGLAELLAGLPDQPQLSYDPRTPYGFRCQWDRGRSFWLTPADPGYCLEYRPGDGRRGSQWFSRTGLNPDNRLTPAGPVSPLLVFVPGTSLVLADPEDWRQPATASWPEAEAGRAPLPAEINSQLAIDRWPESVPAFQQLLCWLVNNDNVRAARHHILGRPETIAGLPGGLTAGFSRHCYQPAAPGRLTVQPISDEAEAA